MERLRETGEGSDLKVICGCYTFHVHRSVVCAISSWFATACREGRWNGQEGVIELQAVVEHGKNEDFNCDDPEAVRLMLDYIYLGRYDTDAADSRLAEADELTQSSQTGPLLPRQGKAVMHTRLYALGSKYSVATLKEYALMKLSRAFISHLDRQDFADAIIVAFNTALNDENGPRVAIVQTLLRRASQLSAEPAIENAIKAIHGLGFELFKRQSRLMNTI